LLNRAVTLATEGATGTVSSQQRVALDTEYQQINNEIASIGSSTNYNGTAVFSTQAQNVFLSDGVSNSTITTTTGTLSNATLGLVAGTIATSTPATNASGQLTIGVNQPAANDTATVGGTTLYVCHCAHGSRASSNRHYRWRDFGELGSGGQRHRRS
jgi:flagellin